MCNTQATNNAGLLRAALRQQIWRRDRPTFQATGDEGAAFGPQRPAR